MANITIAEELKIMDMLQEEVVEFDPYEEEKIQFENEESMYELDMLHKGFVRNPDFIDVMDDMYEENYHESEFIKKEDLHPNYARMIENSFNKEVRDNIRKFCHLIGINFKFRY